MRKALLAAAVLVILAASAILISRRGKEEEKVAEEGLSLVIITRHPSTIWMLARQGFLKSDLAKEYGITKLVFMSPNPKLWPETIRSLGYADIAWGGGPSLANLLVEEGLASPMTDPELLEVVEKIPSEIGGMPLKRYNEEGKPLWCATALSSFGFIINYKVLEAYGLPEPKSWEDLASPEMGRVLPKPAISYARPTQSGSHTRIYQIILQKFGWEKGWEILARLAANGRPYSGSVEALTAVETGEVPVGIAIDFYGYSAEIEFPGTKYVLPFNESIVGGDPIMLLVTSKHPDAAQAFIKWVLSVEGQKIWLDPRVNRMPILEEVFETPEGRAREDLRQHYFETVNNIGIKFNETLAELTYFSVGLYFESAFCDVHDLLVETWMAMIEALEKGELSEEEFWKLAEELGKPLSWEEEGEIKKFTLEYAISVNERIRDDPSFSSEMASIWRRAAEERYREILAKLGRSG